MGTITLVRHGQANSSAKDEDGYDRLSPLGWQQAEWLGDWFRDQEENFDLVLSGSLRRQRETSAAIGFNTPEIDPSHSCFTRWGHSCWIQLGAAP